MLKHLCALNKFRDRQRKLERGKSFFQECFAMIGKQLRVFIVQQYQVTNKNNLIRCGLKENYSLVFNFFC